MGMYRPLYCYFWVRLWGFWPHPRLTHVSPNMVVCPTPVVHLKMHGIYGYPSKHSSCGCWSIFILMLVCLKIWVPHSIHWQIIIFPISWKPIPQVVDFPFGKKTSSANPISLQINKHLDLAEKGLGSWVSTRIWRFSGTHYVKVLIFGEDTLMVNIHKTMENHHGSWLNQLFLLPFSKAFWMFTRGFSPPNQGTETAGRHRVAMVRGLEPSCVGNSFDQEKLDLGPLRGWVKTLVPSEPQNSW